MKEQPNSPYEFWTHVYPIRLPHRSSMAGTRLVSRLTTALRRQKRGLDTSLAPRRIFPPCGECAGVTLGETSTSKTKTETAEVMVEADLGSPFRFRCVSWNGRMLLSDLLASLPVHPIHQVNTVAVFRIVCGELFSS